jgi:hypothetical protein
VSLVQPWHRSSNDPAKKEAQKHLQLLGIGPLRTGVECSKSTRESDLCIQREKRGSIVKVRGCREECRIVCINMDLKVGKGEGAVLRNAVRKGEYSMTCLRDRTGKGRGKVSSSQRDVGTTHDQVMTRRVFRGTEG